MKPEEVDAARDAAAGGHRRGGRPRRAQAGPDGSRRRPFATGPRQPGDRRPAAAGTQGRGPADRAGPGRDQPGAGRAADRAGGRARGADAGRGDRRRHAADRPDPARLPTPDHPDVRPHRRPVRRHGLGGRRGPRRRGRVAELRRPQPRPGPPGADHAGHVLDRAGRPPRRAAHPHLAGPGAHDADPRASDLRHLSGPGLPHRRVRRHPQPDVPPGRGPGGRPRHHHGQPQGHARPLRDPAVRRRHHDAVPAVVLPVHRAVGRGRPGLLRVPRPGARGRDPAVPARARAGSSGVAAVS